MLQFFRRLLKGEPYDPMEIQKALTIGPQVDTVPNASGRFGYDKSNPIPVHWPQGELDYLAGLQCECGVSFLFHRMGSFDQGPDGHLIDGYELICRNRKHRFKLFMDMYHAGPSSLLPEGLTKGPQEGVGVPVRVKDFPDGLPAAIRTLAALHGTQPDE